MGQFDERVLLVGLSSEARPNHAHSHPLRLHHHHPWTHLHHWNHRAHHSHHWSYGSSRHRVESSEATWNLSFWHLRTVDNILRLLFKPLLIVCAHIVLVLTSSIMRFSYGRRVMS